MEKPIPPPTQIIREGENPNKQQKSKYKVIFYKGDYWIFKRVLGLIYWPTINYFHTEENAINYCKKLNYYNDKKY